MKKQTVQLNVVLEKKLKEDVVKVLDELGMSMSGAINIYLKQIVKTGGIPFQIKK